MIFPRPPKVGPLDSWWFETLVNRMGQIMGEFEVTFFQIMGIPGDFYVLDLYHLHPLRYIYTFAVICSYLRTYTFDPRDLRKKRRKG